MQSTDWILVIVILLSMALGGKRGFISELISLLLFAIALYIAYQFAHPITDWASEYVQSKYARFLTGFFVSAVLLYSILSFVAGILLKGFNNFASASIINLLAGAIYGIMRGIVIVLIAAIVVHNAELQNQSWWADAKFNVVIEDLLGWSKTNLTFINDFIYKNQINIPS